MKNQIQINPNFKIKWNDLPDFLKLPPNREYEYLAMAKENVNKDIDEVTEKIICLGKKLDWFTKFKIKGLSEKDYIKNDGKITIIIVKSGIRLFSDISNSNSQDELEKYLLEIINQIPKFKLFTLLFE